MSPVECDGQAARRQLERVLQSPGFVRNDRLSRFLRFVVEQHLEGRDDELKESLLAIEVFGRKPDYNPKHDPIVRTEAGRLRARLSEYYTGEGRGDTLVIELPKGGYTPWFRQPEVTREIAAPLRSRFGTRRWLMAALASLAVALAALGWWRVRDESAPLALPVRPLGKLRQAPSHEYFAPWASPQRIRHLSH